MPVRLKTLHSGYIDILNLRPDQIDIRDIAHSLSGIYRWNAHTTMGRSVADHSLNMAMRALDERGPYIALLCLMHDSPETYIGDITSDFKEWLDVRMGGELKALETSLFNKVLDKFGIPRPTDADMAVVKEYDLEDRESEGELLFQIKTTVENTIGRVRTYEEFLRAFSDMKAAVDASEDSRSVLESPV